MFAALELKHMDSSKQEEEESRNVFFLKTAGRGEVTHQCSKYQNVETEHEFLF